MQAGWVESTKVEVGGWRRALAEAMQVEAKSRGNAGGGGTQDDVGEGGRPQWEGGRW